MKSCHECGLPIVGHGGMTRCHLCQRVYFSVMEEAHHAVSKAIRLGELPSLSLNEVACVDCGSRATVYDHRDYRRPLVVQPVCRKCNYRRGPAVPLTPAAVDQPQGGALVEAGSIRFPDHARRSSDGDGDCVSCCAQENHDNS